jgi:hypothetical protein
MGAGWFKKLLGKNKDRTPTVWHASASAVPKVSGMRFAVMPKRKERLDNPIAQLTVMPKNS